MEGQPARNWMGTAG